jgi:hypothetical protein
MYNIRISEIYLRRTESGVKRKVVDRFDDERTSRAITIFPGRVVYRHFGAE